MSYISIKNLNKNFGTFQALKNVNLSFEKGKIYGIVGKNGAGKTTLLKCILNLITTYNGEVNIADNSNSARTNIGALIETPEFFPYMTGYQNLNYYSKAYGIKSSSINHILDLVNLNEAKNKKFKNYSLGMKQRLGIGLALLGNPDLLILDEPINGIDPTGIIEIRNLLKSLVKNENKTIIISSHILSEIENISDSCVIIDNGKIVELIGDIKNNSYVSNSYTIKTSNDDIAYQLLSSLDYIKYDNNNLFLQDGSKLNTVLMIIIKNNINVNDIIKHHETLENYYLKKIGGNNND